jgi:SNF2 family DNA or RNA helicase
MGKPLWEHQKRDIKRMAAQPTLFNMSDPGTGKSRVCIEAIKRLSETSPIPVLIIAPKSILQCAWGNDIDEFAPELTYMVATAKNREEAFLSPAQIIITNHDAVTWMTSRLKSQYDPIARFNGGWLIIDESTAFKNPRSLRSRAAAAIRPHFSRCTCMTGTPIPNGLIDIWHQQFLVDLGARLGASFYRFRANTHTPILKGGFTEWNVKDGMADAVAELISDVTIRNKRDDCMDLPDNQTINCQFILAPAHAKKYQAMKKHALVELKDNVITAVNAAVLLNKLLQIASGAVYDAAGNAVEVSTERYGLIMDLVDEREHSVVVFNWAHQRAQLTKLAEKRGYAYGFIDGTISSVPARTKTIDDFQQGKLKVLFIQPQSAAHGITLTKGTATIWASPTYNAELFDQCNARIFRGGQTQKTETILVCAKDTVEANVYRALMEKRLNMRNLLELIG